jgi:hypothetical protein
MGTRKGIVQSDEAIKSAIPGIFGFDIEFPTTLLGLGRVVNYLQDCRKASPIQ